MVDSKTSRALVLLARRWDKWSVDERVDVLCTVDGDDDLIFEIAESDWAGLGAGYRDLVFRAVNKWEELGRVAWRAK